MFKFKGFDEQQQEKEEKNLSRPPYSAFSEDLEENVKIVMEVFKGNDTIVMRRIENHQNPAIKCCIIFTDGLVNSNLINESLIYPVQTMAIKKSQEDLTDVMMNQVLRINEICKTDNIDKITQSIVYGDTALFIQGSRQALLLNTKGFKLRAVDEPESEKVLQGPREGFTEGLLLNLSLIRRKIRTPDLKMKYMKFGERTKTLACVCYIDGIVNKNVLEELFRRLKKFDMDGALDVNYIMEMIRDSRYSPFKSIGLTERPDVVAAKLLEGRVALLLDGTPMVMTVPHLFVENFQSSEDYYVNYFYSALTRPLRYMGFYITICLPAFYVAVLTFHQEMLPTPLLLSVSMARQGVPFPTMIETLGMIIIFQILTETGIRMPKGVGNALSIVGALVIGQAAVEARIVSAPVIIITSLTGITGLLVPRLNAVVLPVRVAFLLLSSFLGIYGLIFGLVFLLVHLLNMRSFGVPYITDFVLANFQEVKDLVVRAPWWKMHLRPKFVAEDRVRMRAHRED